MKEKAFLKAKQRQIDYNQTFTTEPGKRVLTDIITMCHILEPMATPDPYAIAFREGERNVGLTILRLLKVSPEQYITIIEENLGDKK